MDTLRVFNADTETDLWQQVAADLAHEEGLLEYAAELQQGGYRIRLNIDIDLGGGFEGGDETTMLTAVVPTPTPLRFALHEEDWIHEIGKFLGLTDVQLGYPDLDDAFIITTNDPAALHALFADAELRRLLLQYQDLRLTLAPTHLHDPNADLVLTLLKEDQALVEPAQLQDVYHLVYSLLRRIAPLPA